VLLAGRHVWVFATVKRLPGSGRDSCRQVVNTFEATPKRVRLQT
jgi:hypothetical protein